MQKTEAAMILAGVQSEENRQASAPTNLHVITGTVSGKSSSGKTLIEVEGLVFSDDDSQCIEVDTLGGLEEGDVATILLSGEDGHGMVPMAIGAAGSVDRIDVRINVIEQDYVKASVLEAEVAELGYAHITNGVIDNAHIDVANVDNLSANYASIDNLNAATGRIDTLEANTADIDTIRANSAKVKNLTAAELEADHAKVGTLDATYATITNLNAATGRIDNLEAADATITGRLDAAEGNITSLTAADATITGRLDAAEGNITSLSAQTAKIENLTAEQLSAATGYVGALTAGNVTANDIIADHAEIDGLDSNYAHITNGVIDNAQIDKAKVNGLAATYATITNLQAAEGRITNLESSTVTTDYLEANYIDSNTINSNYLQTNMMNADVSWIQNGVIKDGSIVNGMIQSVSANKLTAGTIDASNITVINLNADNITTGTINGQRIGEGSLSLSKLEEDVYTESEIDGKLATMQAEIDGAIETWTGTAVPTLNNAPAVNWNTNAIKDTHVGDVYFVVNSQSQQNGYNYRFTKSGSTYSWQLIKDSDVTNALQRLTTVEGQIGTIEQFDSDISSWRTDTDEELSSIKSNHTTLVTRVDKTIVETVQLWYSKANTTAPSKPTSEVTSTSTSGNAWRTVVPAYNASYPNYFYCYQWQYSDGTFGWSSVTRDIATGEAQSTSRTASTNASTALTNAATAQSTADGAATAAGNAQSTADGAASTASTALTNAATAQSTADGAASAASNAQTTANSAIKSSVQLWFTKANTTAPGKPTAQVTTNNAATGNAWNLAVPTYNASYPYYYYCYQQQRADGTWQWSDVVYDRATTENQKNAHDALTGLSTKVETSTFNTLSQTVDSNTADITTLTTITTNNGLTSSTNITNTVNTVSQTATSNSSKITQLTTTLGTNADGTTKEGDIVHRTSAVEQDLSGFKSTVSETYSTKTELSQVEESVNQNAKDIAASQPFVKGTQTAATRFWTGECPELESLEDGQQITYWLPYAYKSETATSKGITADELDPAETITSSYSNDWLNLTLADGSQTGWVPCYYSGTTRMTSHYGANNAIHLTYREGVSNIARGWWGDANYVDGNTTFSKYSTGATVGKNAMRSYTLVMKDDAGNWTSIVNSYSTGTSKAHYTGGLQIGNVLYYSSGTNNVAAGGACGDGLWESYPIDFRYSANITTSALTARMPVYLVGTLGSEDGLFYLDDVWWTQTPPTTADGKVYILVGTAYSGYQVHLAVNNPTYQYINDKFQEFSIARLSNAETAIVQTNEQIALKANSSDVYTKTAVDGFISEEVTNRNAAITAKANEITTSVSETYTTKTEFNNLEIGGRNLFVSSTATNGYPADKSVGAAYVITGMTSNHQAYELIPVTEGESYVAQYWVEDSAHQGWVCIQLLDSDGVLVKQIYRRAPGKDYWSMVFTIPDGVTTALISGRHLAKGYEYAKIKLEKGTKPTDWTPAPEDMATDADLTALTNRVSSAESSITQNANNIALKVSESDVTGNYLVGKINLDATTATIAASKVNIQGAAIFTSGRLSESSLNDAYDAKGAATTAEANAKAAIPSDISELNNDSGFITSADVPTKVSELTNDSGFQTSSQVNTAITSKGYATTGQVATAKSEAISAAATDATTKANAAEQNAKDAIPTDISELNNDSGFITSADVPTKVSELTNDSGFQTSSQVNTAITSKGYQTSSQVESAITSKGYATTTQAQGYADAAEQNAKDAIPDNLSDFTNDLSMAWQGSCATAANTAAKTVTCAGFALVAGATVTVRFSNGNTSAAALTLNVNSTGAKTIYVGGAATAAANELLWAANAMISFTYDGSYWRVTSEPRSWYGTSSTAAGTAAKTATVNEVVICKGSIVSLQMTYANTVANPTLNVSSLGAKAIYTAGARPTATSSNNWTAASTVAFIFDGQYFRYDSDAATKANAAASTVNTALSNYITSNDAALQTLQNQVDGQIEAWYKTVDPTSSNEPASTWTTDALKQRHEGDLYYNVENGHSWRWLNNNGIYSWQQIPDSDAAAALAAAQNAQTSANSKRRIFTTTPTVPYDIGDLWVSGTEVKYATASKTSSQSYSASDWKVTATDDSNIPTKVSELTNDSNYGTTSQIATAKSEAISSANSATDTKLQSYSTTAQMNAAIATKADSADSVEYIVGTQTAATGSWTGVTRDSSLFTGKKIAYKLPYAGSGNASLQLKDSAGNNVGENIAVYLGTTRMTTHFGAGSVIQMVFDGTYWRATSIPNSNTYDRIYHNNAIKAATAVTAGHIICGTSAGYKNIAAGTTFDLSYPLLYSPNAIAAAATRSDTYIKMPSVAFSNNGTITSGATYAMLYLVGTISANTFTIAASPFMTTVAPTTEDGRIYIPLGIMSSATAGYFESSSQLYAYLDGKFRQVTPTEIVATHRIYYRTATANSSLAAPTAWVEEATGNVYNAWTTKVPPLAASTAASQTKYLYLYTCEQRKRLDGTIQCTKVLLDENTTVVDGGQIITNSVTANQIDADSVKANIVQTTDISAERIFLMSGEQTQTLMQYKETVSTDLQGKVDQETFRSVTNNLQEDVGAKVSSDDLESILSEYDADLRDDISTTYATSQALNEATQNLSNTLSNLGATFVTSDALTDLANQLAAGPEAFQQLNSYIYVDKDVDNQPVVFLGAAISKVQAMLSNNVLTFLYRENATDSPQEVAYIGADESGVGRLYVVKAVVVKEISFGHWTFFERNNYNMAIRWTGDE